MKASKGKSVDVELPVAQRRWNEIPISIWYLLLAALAARLIGFVVYLFAGGTGMVTDSGSYINPAIEFTKTFSFGESAFRTPGYPFLIAVCLGIFREYYYYGLVILQIIISVYAILYVYRLAVLITKRHFVGVVAVILVAFNPLDIMYDYLVLTDSVSQALLLIAIYHFAYYINSIQDRKPSVKSVICSGILLAINVLIRPSLMYLPLALAFGAVVVSFIFRCYKQILVSLLCVCVVTQAPVIAWTYRNRTVANYDGYSTVSDINLYYYNAVVVYAKEKGLSYYQAREQMLQHQDEGLLPYLETMPEYEAIRNRGLELVKSDLLYYASCCLKNCCWIAFYPGAMTFKSISGGITEAITAVKSGGDILQVLERTLKPATFFPIAVLGIDVLILLLLAVLSWIGIFKSYKKNWIAATLMLGVIAYIYVVSCQPVGIGSYSRFRIACSMLTAIFSAYGLETIVLFCKKRRGDQ